MKSIKLWQVTCKPSNLATGSVRLADSQYVNGTMVGSEAVFHVAADSLAEVEELVGDALVSVTARGPVLLPAWPEAVLTVTGPNVILATCCKHGNPLKSKDYICVHCANDGAVPI